MLERFFTVADSARHEIAKVKGSRFIGDVVPLPQGSTEVSEASLEEGLRRIRAELHDARHHCWAWRRAPDGKLFRSSDDGEPSGSAGRPILQEIEGRELTDVLVVVTRYFGGTKLGVGGLVRAYGEAAAEALDRAPRRTVVLTERVRVSYPYDCSAPVQAVLRGLALEPVESDFGAEVTQLFDVPLGQAERFRRELFDRTSGRVRAE